MANHHNNTHDHRHHSPANLTTAFVLGIILNLIFVVIEFTTGFYANSLALLSDAGHNLSDVASLALSLFAILIARRKATSRFTFGFQKGTILVSLANAVILLIAVGSIGWEAIQRFMTPVETEGKTISMVAGIGIVINSISALLFFRHKEKDINVRGAYLHLATDALVSFGVVISGIIISETHIKWIDPLISLLIMAVVIYSTWGLLIESLNLSLDAVPVSIDLEKTKNEILKNKEVLSVHDIHIWAMSTTKNALIAHLIIDKDLNEEQIIKLKEHLRHELEHLNIHHTTFETELSDCKIKEC